MVAGVVGFYATTSSAHAIATKTQTPAGAPPLQHFGHPLVGAPGLSIGSGASLGAVTCPSGVGTCEGTYNWAGYAVDTGGTVTKVVGSWTVPTIAVSTSTTCPDGQKTWDSNAEWVGIDGISAANPTVEQTGTSADCYYGSPQYYAWYEFYPQPSVILPLTISPGDSVKATVWYTSTNATGPQFKATLDDLTTGKSYTSPKVAVAGAAQLSAEWIDESPYYDGFLGLTHIGQVIFTGASATIGGVTNNIGAWSSSDIYYLYSVDYNFPYDLVVAYTKALPTALTSTGSFKVNWESDGP